jgi:hypothetical protein
MRSKRLLVVVPMVLFGAVWVMAQQRVVQVDPATNMPAALAVDATLDTTSKTTGPQGFCHGVTSMPSAVTTGRSARVLCTVLGLVFNAPAAASLGGATPVAYISAGSTEDEHVVCSGPCNWYSLLVTNSNASPRYLKCENDTAANTAPGTDTPEFRAMLPPTGGAALSVTVGLFFSNAITCWVVTGAADSDATEVAANEVMLNYGVK